MATSEISSRKAVFGSRRYCTGRAAGRQTKAASPLVVFAAGFHFLGHFGRFKASHSGTCLCGRYHGRMDDKLKEKLMPALLVFNFTLVGYLVLKTILPMFGGKAMMLGGFMTHLLIGAGIGLVTGGLTLGLMMLKK